MTVRVPTDLSLIASPYTPAAPYEIIHMTSVAMTGAETNSADNYAETPTALVGGTTASIAGYTYLDHNGNVFFENNGSPVYGGDTTLA